MRSMKTTVILPTYNEAGNIRDVISRIFEHAGRSDLDIIVADDRSPDGTAGIVRQIASRDNRVTLLEGKGRRGRGIAGKRAFEYALSAGADIVVEMDADMSHDPLYIPDMLNKLETCDIVIGSRFIPGGADERGSFLRRLISRSAKSLINLTLGIRVSDPTSGFRCFRRKALEQLAPSTLVSADPFIVLEVLDRAVSAGLVIREVPVRFREREKERSKLTMPLLLRCLKDLLVYRFSGAYREKKRRIKGAGHHVWGKDE
ncbi:MAG: glycosyltransferase [Candidatus Omnitrophica bacterium]|nr:glycosyltransferase [Candidatus Omnitrophota bacterium]